MTFDIVLQLEKFATKHRHHEINPNGNRHSTRALQHNYLKSEGCIITTKLHRKLQNCQQGK